MSGQLFPDYIECALLNTYRCEGCGQSGETLQVSFPSLAWQREDEAIHISYPVRCPCGQAGVATAKLPFLLFSFICGWLEYHGTMPQYRGPAPRRPQGFERPVRPSDSPLLAHIFCDFEEVLASYAKQGGREQGEAAACLDVLTETDRALLGISPQGWPKFLKRMGFGEEEGQTT